MDKLIVIGGPAGLPASAVDAVSPRHSAARRDDSLGDILNQCIRRFRAYLLGMTGPTKYIDGLQGEIPYVTDAMVLSLNADRAYIRQPDGL